MIKVIVTLQQEPKQQLNNEQVNPCRKQSNDFKNIHDIENKLTRFQIYHETEFACNYSNPLYKTQYSEILVEYEKGFDMTTGKIKFDPGGKLKPYDSESTPLQDMSLMNSFYFGNIH